MTKKKEKKPKEEPKKVESELDLIEDYGIFMVDIPKEILLEMIKASPKLKAFAWQEIKRSIERRY